MKTIIVVLTCLFLLGTCREPNAGVVAGAAAGQAGK